MTTEAATPTTNEAAGPRPSLLRAEVRRFRKRRFIRLLLLTCVVLYVVTVAVAVTQYEKPSAAGLAQAQQRVNELVDEQARYRADCISALPTTGSADTDCGPVPTAADFGDVSDFLPHKPFLLNTGLSNFAIAFGVGFAALAFLIGGTWIGAEWSTKNLAAWLTWEPRRFRVMAAKVTVLAAAVAGVAALVQLAWLGTAYLLAANKGVTDVPADFWGDLWATQGRLVVFAVLAAIGGFGLANLTRNMAAAVGIAFLYFAVVETLVRLLHPSWARWLLTDNSIGFLQAQGYTFRWYDPEAFQGEPRALFISHWGGGLTLTAVVLILLVPGIVLFRRRDLT